MDASYLQLFESMRDAIESHAYEYIRNKRPDLSGHGVENVTYDAEKDMVTIHADYSWDKYYNQHIVITSSDFLQTFPNEYSSGDQGVDTEGAGRG